MRTRITPAGPGIARSLIMARGICGRPAFRCAIAPLNSWRRRSIGMVHRGGEFSAFRVSRSAFTYGSRGISSHSFTGGSANAGLFHSHHISGYVALFPLEVDLEPIVDLVAYRVDLACVDSAEPLGAGCRRCPNR